MTPPLPDRIHCLSVPPAATLLEAMQAIDRGACGIALIVDEHQRLLGVVTDGNIRRALLAGASLGDGVGQYMYRQFTAVEPQTGRTEVLDLMRARTLSQVPIVDHAGRLVGLHLLREIVGSERQPNWAVIMAGGRGERLRPLTDVIPKPMIRVAGRPILERIVLHLVGAGIRRIFLSVNYLAQMIEEHFGDGGPFGCTIEYLRETTPLGTGGALSLLPELPQHPLLVLNGDLVTQFDTARMLAYHEQGGYVATIGLHEYAHDVPYAVADVAEGQLAQLVEKPTVRWLVNAGIYLLSPAVLLRVPRDTPSTVPGLLEDCLKQHEPVGAFFIEDEWLDVGRHNELRRATGREQPPP